MITLMDMNMRALIVTSLLFLLCVNGVFHCFAENKLLKLEALQWKRPNYSHSRRVSKESLTTVNDGITVLEMKHRCDQTTTCVNAFNKKLKKRLVVDDLHVQSLQSHIKKILSNISNNQTLESSKTQIEVTSGIKLEILNYIVTVRLGGRNMTVIVDTGSDLTWVQCQPCKSCYNQKEPIFNPSDSHTYQTVTCKSTTCQSLQFAAGNYGVCDRHAPSRATAACEYEVSYGDGSRTRGDLARDSLALGATHVMDGFVFGCGHNNTGLFGGASGLMGLGRSDLSFVSQSAAIYGGVFSYCLPSADPGASGSLTLGSFNHTPFSYTRLLPNPQLPTFYFLNLTGVSVGAAAVPASPAAVLIDSGTVITRLPPALYRAVRAEFLNRFSGFPAAPGFSILDTCFDLTGLDRVSVPAVTMRFEGGAELDVDVAGVLYMVKNDASQVCLALASLSYEYEIGIIGNYQQKNQRVVYDTKEARVGFAGETCRFAS